MGNSMDKAGTLGRSLVLVCQHPIASNGGIGIAQIDGQATIKECHCQSQTVVLKPRSSSLEHKPTNLMEDFQVVSDVQMVIDNSTIQL